jgi:hypothetical protein
MQRSQPDNEGKGPSDREKRSGGRQELWRYMGLASQVAVSVGLAVFLGVKADKWLKVSFPILSWALPLLVIVGLIVQLIKASSGKK